jgi:KDO2-lipid IV(A) lauroyltransferase
VIRHRIEHAAVATVAAVVRALPRQVGFTAGTALGLAVYLADAPHRRLTEANLAAAFPAKPPGERRAIARAVFAHFGRLLMGLLTFSSLPRDRMLELVDVDGAERVRQAHAKGKGVLLFTGHFGFWEVHAIAHSLILAPMAVMARPLDNPYLHRMLENMRTSTGNTVIYRRFGIRRVMRALANNQAVALLIDQHIHGGDAVYVDFFNRPAATTSALAAVALRTGAPVIPCFALPLPGGRYRIIYEHAVEPPPEGPDALREFTQRCTDVLEMYVRRYPELWLWMHRRWRDIDPAMAPRGMFPEAAANDATTPLEAGPPDR